MGDRMRKEEEDYVGRADVNPVGISETLFEVFTFTPG